MQTLTVEIIYIRNVTTECVKLRYWRTYTVALVVILTMTFIVCPFSLRPRICRKLCSPVQPYLKQHIVLLIVLAFRRGKWRGCQQRFVQRTIIIPQRRDPS